MSCISDAHQPFPRTGVLAQNLNLSLDDLRLKIGKTQATVYSYIVASVKNSEGHFIQTGGAPNFQGDVVSLCTCKHFMRTFLDKESWPGTWVAGFTSKKAENEKNALIYLMKVGSAFESYYELWSSDKLPDTVKQAKLAHRNKFGDVFQPQSGLIDKNFFNPQNYFPPVPDHVHAPKDGWHKDINYIKGVCGRKAALLIGDTQYSFLWDEPMLFYPRQLSRGQKKDNLQYLLASFQK